MAKKSILTENMESCFVCGNPYIEIHHVFYGTANRKISDKYGLVIPLCHEHHTGNHGIHFNKDFDAMVKKYAQERFESLYGADKDFRSIFGKSYL